MEEVIEEAIIEEVCTEDAIIVCLSVRNKFFSEETEAGRELGFDKLLLSLNSNPLFIITAFNQLCAGRRGGVVPTFSYS